MIAPIFILLLQSPAAPPAAPPIEAKPAFTLEKLAGNKWSLVVPPGGALLSDIAVELKSKLEVPVTVSKTLATARLKSGFNRPSMEEALTRLSPRAYIDYRATSGPAGKTMLTTVTLQDAAETAPPLPRESHTSMVFEGIPDDPTVETLEPLRQAADAQKMLEPLPPGPFLRISYQHGLVTLRAHQVTPAAIANDLAMRLSVAFTLHSGFDVGPTDLEITSVPVDELARWLPPGMSVLYRREASTRVVTPLRILMGEPPARPQQ